MKHAPASHTVLIIDDEESLRHSIASYLEDSGYRVIQAPNGADGVRMFIEHTPCIVLTDLRMPVLDGVGVIKAVRETDQDVPIVVVSGTGMIADAVDAMRKGADDYIAKPIQEMQELQIIIERCLENAEIRRNCRKFRENIEELLEERTRENLKLTAAVEQSTSAIIITDPSGIIEYANPRACITTGFRKSELVGQNPRILKSGIMDQSVYQVLWETITKGTPWSGELASRRKDGSIYWELCTIFPLKDRNGQITHFVASKENISQRKDFEQQLLFQSTHDPLTGLPNRHSLFSLLASLMQDTLVSGHILSVLMINLDSFANITNTHGHEFGDNLLVKAVERIRTLTAEPLLFCRFTDDTLVLVIPERFRADELAETIRSGIAEPFIVHGIDLYMTATIGIADTKDGTAYPEELLNRAESAMMKGKQDGKNSIVRFSPELVRSIKRRNLLQTKVIRAMDMGELSLHYQPQINIHDNSITGFESLLRWTGNDGSVSPMEFIPVMEDTGVIHQVGEWVIWTACAQCREWSDKVPGGMKMSVNISPLQFMKGNLPRIIRGVLDNTGLDPAMLCLEITEGISMEDSSGFLGILQSIKELGVTISLDDFGTGYSNLRYLARLPLDEMKIDRSFISSMLSTRNSALVVNSIINMAKGLGLRLVAEGVETIAQRDYLMVRGCRTVQGFLYAKPMDRAACSEYIMSRIRHD